MNEVPHPLDHLAHRRQVAERLEKAAARWDGVRRRHVLGRRRRRGDRIDS